MCAPFRITILIAFLSLSFCGCTHLQLQRNYNHQAKSISQIYEHQVLDNLAMFASNHNATPFFAVPGTGTNSVNDQLKTDGIAGILTGRFWKFVTLGGSRQMNETWPLIPVVEPNRLQLMQCAYQRSIGAFADDCQQCCKIEQAWYGNSYICGGPCDITCGWLKTSTHWSDVPKCCCNSYGRHCGLYAWVEPCHQDQFSRLVMRIVDYASGKPSPPKQNTEIRFYLNADGSPGSIADHFSAMIANDSNKSLADLQKELGIVAKSSKLANLQNEMTELSLLTVNDKNKETVASKINNAFAARIQGFDASSSGVRIDDPITSVDTRRQELAAMIQLEIDSVRSALEADLSAIEQRPQVPSSRTFDFGPPTQTYGGGSVLLLQQQLNAINPR